MPPSESNADMSMDGSDFEPLGDSRPSNDAYFWLGQRLFQSALAQNIATANSELSSFHELEMSDLPTGSIQCADDRSDYENFIATVGFTWFIGDAEARKQLARLLRNGNRSAIEDTWNEERSSSRTGRQTRLSTAPQHQSSHHVSPSSILGRYTTALKEYGDLRGESFCTTSNPRHSTCSHFGHR
ncbi:hypothetical protein MRB53_038340 [Persea americana]|nr:hypothetical protein MRB53_038340 [Persea americana]